MKDDRYNGWTNYATWRVQLEIISDYVDAEIERIKDGDTELVDMAAYELGNYLHEYVEETILTENENSQSLETAYARAFLDDVNWRELAEHAQEVWSQEKVEV